MLTEKKITASSRTTNERSTDRETLLDHLIEARFLARDNGLTSLDSMLAMAMMELEETKPR